MFERIDEKSSLCKVSGFDLKAHSALAHKISRLGIERPAVEQAAEPTLEYKVRQEILAACRRANWKLGGPRGAAARLGLKRTTLFL